MTPESVSREQEIRANWYTVDVAEDIAYLLQVVAGLREQLATREAAMALMTPERAEELHMDQMRLDWLTRNPPNHEMKPMTSLSREQIDAQMFSASSVVGERSNTDL